jgi:hypothetical protein
VPGTFQDFYPTGKVVKPLVVAGDEGGNDHGSDEERADEVFFHVEKDYVIGLLFCFAGSMSGHKYARVPLKTRGTRA